MREIYENRYVNNFISGAYKLTYDNGALASEVRKEIENCLERQDKEIERLHSIIKEVREYITDNVCGNSLSGVNKIIEILDKVEGE